MDIVFFTDLHATDKWPATRKDNFMVTAMGKLQWIMGYAEEHNAYLLHGGDLFDRFNTSPTVVNAVMKIFRQARVPDIFTILGNHDVFGRNSDIVDKLMIGTLINSGLVTLLGEDPVTI